MNQIPTDHQLLASYLQGSQDAFHTLVNRYAGLIFSTASRIAPPALAEDITQAVFLLLAQRAHTLRNPQLLPAWLLKVTHYCAADARRAASRRKHHEQKAAAMATPFTTTPPSPDPLEPHLDTALQSLSPPDRTALLLRFYNDHSLAQIAASLNVSEEAAKKRVARALEKLRKIFLRKGLPLALPALATTLAKQSSAAPPALITKITTAALTKSATTTSAALIAKGALKLMAYTTAKWTAAATAALLLITVTTTTLIQHHNAAPLPLPVSTVATPPQTPLAPPTEPIIRTTPSTRFLPKDPIPTIEVRDLATNAPIPNVHLQLVDGFSSRDLGPSAITDSNGTATIPYPPTTNWAGEITANAPGYVPIHTGWERLLPSAPAPDHFLIHLEKAVSIGGRVLDTDGTPLAGATVLINFNKHYDPHTFALFTTTTTNAKGEWTLNAAPADTPLSVGASHPLCLNDLGQIASTPAPFSELLNHTHILRLQRGIPISGTVFGPDSKPRKATLAVGRYAGATMTVPDIQTTDDGRFQFAARSDQPLIITTHVGGLAYQITTLNLKNLPSHTDITLDSPKPLNVHITDNHNNPIPNALLTISSWNTDGNYRPQTFPISLISNQNGDITWNDAPSQSVLAIINAPGCLSRKDVPLDRNTPQKITLLPQPIIRIRALSAADGHPISAFWPQRINPEEFRIQPDGTYALTEYWQVGDPFPLALAADSYMPADAPPALSMATTTTSPSLSKKPHASPANS